MLLKVQTAFTGISVQHGIILDFVKTCLASDAHEETRRKFPAGLNMCVMTQADYSELVAEDRLESNI